VHTDAACHTIAQRIAGSPNEAIDTLSLSLSLFLDSTTRVIESFGRERVAVHRVSMMRAGRARGGFLKYLCANYRKEGWHDKDVHAVTAALRCKQRAASRVRVARAARNPLEVRDL